MWQRVVELNALPPVVCWIIARRPRGIPITTAELMQHTGWSRKKVHRFCGLTTWHDVTNGDTEKFLSACGIMRANWRRHLAYWKRTRFTARNGLTHFAHRTKAEKARAVRILMTLAK